jgi:hypothetical protein
MNEPNNSGKTCIATAAQAVLALAVFVLVAFQTYMLVQARHNLNTAYAGQEKPVEEATKLRQRAEGLAGGVAKLAEAGNANAKAIVENFRRQGVDMKPPAQ